MTALFHLAMALVDGLALVALVRRPRPDTLFWALGAAVGVGAVLAGVVAEAPPFGLMRLLALLFLVHVPLVLAAAAVVLRRRRPRTAAVSLALAAAVGAVAVNAWWIEPTSLAVTHHTLTSPKLLEPTRIVLVADYQAEGFGDYEREVWRTVVGQDPDLVLLTGDYLQIGDPEERARVREETRAYLTEIGFGARRGAFAVRGDVEEGLGDVDWARLFSGLPVMAFEESRTIELRGLTLTALDLADSRRPAFAVEPSRQYHVVFGHAPDFALREAQGDLLLAGHTHGGQVRLPGLGPVVTFSAVPRAWAAGRTDLGGGRTLVVSRGIGMERGHAPRIRFLCRPEIVVLDLVPEKPSAEGGNPSYQALLP